MTGRSRVALLLLAILSASLSLCGCGTHYPSSLRYGIRKDPLVLKDLNNILDPQMEPDRPGQLPLLTAKGLFDARNPMHPKREALFKEHLRDPMKLAAKDREEIEKALDEAFGTPASPKVAGEQVSTADINTLLLDEETLLKGSKLYRVHCLHCHGVTGDGRGPTAPWIHPHPRDFRQALFKFQSVDQLGESNRPPHRDDIVRTLEAGIEGTAMPAFNLLSEAQRENLASYVIHLSLRGRTEYMTIKDGFTVDDNGNLVRSADALKDVNGDLGKYTHSWVQDSLTKWVESQAGRIDLGKHAFPFKEVNFELAEKRDAEHVKNFEVMKKSVHNGYRIFLDPKTAKCETCHVDFGRRAPYKFDEWGTMVKPADLTRPVYRGGRRPIDLFYRVHSGINGAGMANFGRDFTTQELWDIVNFVRVLPYPFMRQKFELRIN